LQKKRGFLSFDKNAGSIFTRFLRFVLSLFGDNRGYAFFMRSFGYAFFIFIGGDIVSKKKKVTLIVVLVLVVAFAGYVGFGYFMVQRQYLHGDNTTDVVDEQSSDTTGETVYDDYDDYNNYNSSDKTDTTPLSEYGFYNLDDMGNILVTIDGYSVSGSDDDYVYFFIYSDEPEKYYRYSKAYEFDDGYMRTAYFYNGKSNYYSWSYDSTAALCDIQSNDIAKIDYAGEKYNIIITERTTFDYSDFVCLKGTEESSSKWFVPYSVINWRKAPEITTIQDSSGTERTACKMYIK
jgi:hypothetical protein